MQAPKQIQGSWQIIPPEVRINILRFLPNEALQALAITARAENELAHSRECHRMRRATLRAIRIDWSVTGPSLFRHNLAFFSTFPHISAENHLKLLQWDVSDFAESLHPYVSATRTPRLRPCIRDRWLTQEDGERLLVDLIEADDLEAVQLLLANGIRSTPTALQKACINLLEGGTSCFRALLHAGGRPTVEVLRRAFATRDEDHGECFVLLLRWVPSSVNELLSELATNPEEAIACLPAKGGVRPTYWDCIEKAGALLEELDHLLISAQSGTLDPECLDQHICETSPLTPCLRKVLNSTLSDSAVCQLLELLIARGAKVTQEILEAGLRRRSETCLKVLFEKSDVVPTTWMLERAIVIEKQCPQLLQALIARGAKPSQLALELAIEHVPSLVPALIKGLQVPWKRALIKAAYFLTKWPAWTIQPADQLPILNLVCLWQPKNVELLGQLLQNMTVTAPTLSPLFFRALRRHDAATLQTLLKHCPDLADEALKKAIVTSTESVTALTESGASLQRAHLVQALKQKPISEEMVLFLLEQECPIDEDLFTLAAKYGTPKIIKRFRKRGGLVTPHILEKAFRRSPFDPTVIEALRDNKLEPHMRRLVAFPIQQLLLKPATEVSARDIKSLFALFSTPTKAPQTFRSNKGKERTGKTTVVHSAPPQDPPNLLIDCFLKLAVQWPQGKIHAALSGIASRHLIIERVSSSHDLALIEKLMGSGPSLTLNGVLIKHGESQAIKLLLKTEQPIPLHMVIELLRSPKGRSDPILSSALSALTPKQSEQLYLHIIRAIAQCKRSSGWEGLFTDDWSRALEVLVKRKVKPSENVLIVAAAVPATEQFNLLETLLPLWKGPIPPQVMIKAIGHHRAETKPLLAKYTASGGNAERLLIAQVQHGATTTTWKTRKASSRRRPPHPHMLKDLLKEGLKPSDSVIAHAIRSRSSEAPEFVRILISPETRLEEEWLLAMAESQSPRVEEVALQLLLHPLVPDSLPKAWISHLIDNPSPKAKVILNWARKLTTIPGLNADALCKVVQSPHPSSLAIAELLISHVRPLPNNLLELAAGNKRHGPKIVQDLLRLGYSVTETAMWNARVSRETHQLLFRARIAQLRKGEQVVISAPPPTDVRIKIEEFNLSDYPYLTDAHLIQLTQKLPSLRKVGTRYSGSGSGRPRWSYANTGKGLAAFIEQCPELQVLDLIQCIQTSKRWSLITQPLPKLQRVTISMTSRTVEQLVAFLRLCPELRELVLSDSPTLDNPHLSQIAKLLPKLSKLSIEGESPEVSMLVQHFPNLRELNLAYGDSITLKQVAILARCQHLECLRITLETEERDEAELVAVKWPERSFAKLRQLKLYSSGVDTDPWVGLVEILNHCLNLDRVRLGHPNLVSDEILGQLAKNCPHLKELKLDCDDYESFDASDTGFKAIASGCHELEKIAVRGELWGRDLAPSFQALAKGAPLKHIAIDGTLEAFKALVLNSPQLETLSWPGVGWNDSLILSLAKSCPKLRKFNLGRTRGITRTGWEALQSCTQLRDLKVFLLSSAKNLAKIATSCPQITSLTSSARSVLDREDLMAIRQGGPLDVERIFRSYRPHSQRKPDLDICWNREFDVLPHDDSDRIQEFWDLVNPHPSWVPSGEVLAVSKRHTRKHPALLDQMIKVVGTLSAKGITAFLRTFSDLTVLNLGSSSLSNWLVPLTQIRPPLRELYCGYFPKGAIAPLAQALPGIRRFSPSSQATDARITALTTAFPGLTHLELFDSDELTFRGIHALAENCPHFQLASLGKSIKPHSYPDVRSAVRSGVYNLVAGSSHWGSWMLQKCGKEIESQHLNKLFAEFFKEDRKDNQRVINGFWSCMEALIKKGMIPDWVPSTQVLETSKPFCEGTSVDDLTGGRKLLSRIFCCMISLCDDAVEAFTRTFSNIDTVRLYSRHTLVGTLVKDRLPVIIRGLPRLSTLGGETLVLSEAGCKAIAVHAKELKTLRTWRITAEGIGAIARGCSKLRVLNLREAADVHLAALAACSHLDSLIVHGLNTTSIQGYRELLQSCTTLKKLYTGYSNHLKQSELEQLRRQYPKVSITYH